MLFLSSLHLIYCSLQMSSIPLTSFQADLRLVTLLTSSRTGHIRIINEYHYELSLLLLLLTKNSWSSGAKERWTGFSRAARFYLTFLPLFKWRTQTIRNIKLMAREEKQTVFDCSLQSEAGSRHRCQHHNCQRQGSSNFTLSIVE